MLILICFLVKGFVLQNLFIFLMCEHQPATLFKNGSHKHMFKPYGLYDGPGIFFIKYLKFQMWKKTS